MGVIERAVDWIIGVAKDDSHGYDQASRWGTPDYDCSSLVISAYKHAGVPLTSTYTGNMKWDFLNHGFSDVTGSVNLYSAAGMERGDVLLHERNHTAMFIGNGQIVHAAGNEYGGATGGQPGDQTGREICIANYFNYGNGGWDCVLRYTAEKSDVDPKPDDPDITPGDKENEDYYIVKQYDSLWDIAERFLGAGYLFPLLMQLNGLKDTTIYPGQVLWLHPQDAEPEPKPSPTPQPDPEPETGAYQLGLQVLVKGDVGDSVRQAQRLLIATGYKMPKWGADGEYGDETVEAVKKFQADFGLPKNGAVDKATMTKLLGL